MAHFANMVERKESSANQIGLSDSSTDLEKETTVVTSSKMGVEIVQKSTRFSWIGGYFFHTGADMQIKRFIREDEIFDILKACHDGPCGGHFAERRTAHNVLQTGYYWPTIFKDANKFVQACDSYQWAGRPGQADEMPLRPQLVIEPFERWALDFVGPINPSSN